MARFAGSRVVVTGLGCYTSIGSSVKESWNGLLRGQSGIQKLQNLDEFDSKYKDLGKFIPPNVAVGKVGFDAKKYPILSSQDVRRTATFSQVAIVAAEEALVDAKLLNEPTGRLIDGINPERAGCIIGTGIPSASEMYEAASALHGTGRSSVSPLFIPKFLNNMASGNISIKFQLKGLSNSPSTACATGNNAIGDAYNFIKLGYADFIVAGASEMNVHPLTLAGFCKARSISSNGVSRPFDTNRDGFVLGEGCGILILESLDHAKKRKAKILAEVVGYGLSTDAYHITSPLESGDGARRAMDIAVRQAMAWEDRHKIGYVNAHATSTLLGDRAEARGIKQIFGSHDVAGVPLDKNHTLVSSTKGHIGHLLGAAGAVEALFTVKALVDGIIPHTLNLETVGGAKGDEKEYFNGLKFVKDRPMTADIEYAMSNSFGFGGINTSLLFKKFQDF
ncbi:HCL158Wp [Eremothecium sinecaudum]|uniref:beta-ketoacyl-[acyl-carrier-protein] synthase I n=1 Tax=Eremothecium sinecaudum TaxID=45286 RepID=A0A109UYR4_9SACH|nr:HCL158Wp [Eremothecium sinecaudum]AMD19993.1 HCL158Wp [Eremothecium sinecaudum]